MPRQRARWWTSGAGGALVLGSTLLRGTPAGVVLLLGALVALAWVAGALVTPWLGARRRVRVRYHAGALTDSQAATLGRSLDTLARATDQGLVSIWRREAGELTWTLEIPGGGELALQRLLVYLLPEATLEPVPAPPPVRARGFYHWSLRRAGRGGVQDPLDAGALRDSDVLAGDFELHVRLVPGAGAVVVHGTPGPGAVAAGLRPLWRPLWRYMNRSSGATATSPDPGLHSSASSRVPWPLLLLRHYPLVEAWTGPWPRPPAIRVPAAGAAGTARLATHASLQIAVPADYRCPAGAILLGVSSVDGRPLGLPLGAGPDPTQPCWSGHFFVLGADRATRQGTATAVIAQALAAGAGVIHLDPTGTLGPQLAGHSAVQGKARLLWSDLENPGGSVHLNLLAAEACGPDPAAAEAGALILVLEEYLPVLASYLRLLGVRTGAHSDGTFFLDWARVLVLMHHRGRLIGQVPGFPLPDLPGLYALLDAVETLPALVAQELTIWTTPDADLSAALAAAGSTGAQAATLARTTLQAAQARLAAQTPSERRLTAANLRTRLRPALDYLALVQLWRGATEAPADLLNRRPGPLWLSRLPIRKVATVDAGAARLYGYYLLALVIGVARARRRAGQRGPALLLVLEDVRVWTAGGLLQNALDVLGQAEIAVLMTSAQLPPEPGGLRLLQSAGTWWIATLDAGDVAPIRAQLRTQGVTADLPLAGLPAGVSICKTSTAAGPLVATVYTDLPRLGPARAAGAARELTRV